MADLSVSKNLSAGEFLTESSRKISEAVLMAKAKGCDAFIVGNRTFADGFAMRSGSLETGMDENVKDFESR